MPYIKQPFRDYYDDLIAQLVAKLRNDFAKAGSLNYIITKILVGSMLKESYSNYNELMGVLECVKQELYRRRIAPYEDEKIKENGDIF